MERGQLSAFLMGRFWTGWRAWVARSICILSILMLGLVREATDIEFALASLLVLPVLLMAWMDGTTIGLVVALVAAVTWGAEDIIAEKQFDAPWIPWANAVTRWMTYTVVAYLAAQVRLQFEREHERATRDPLTGLLNRRAYLQAGAQEAERSMRYRHSMAVAFLDLDDFKLLNDRRGHDVGDRALQATADALRGAVRAGDLVARLGGDEFSVLLPEIGFNSAIAVGRKLSQAVNVALLDFPPVRVSIGVAWFKDTDFDFPSMMKSADRLMYEAKKSGKESLQPRDSAGASRINMKYRKHSGGVRSR